MKNNLTKHFPAVHVNRLKKLANDIRKREEVMQRLHGDALPRSGRASNLLDLRSITEILWCIEKVESPPAPQQ